MDVTQTGAPTGLRADFERELTLRDGRRVRLRPIQPGDAESLRHLLDGLSERSRRLRFFGYKPPLDPELARAMARVDFRDRMAFVAILEGEARMVADCRLYRISRTQAEIAIAVADDCQGQGLGRALLEHVLAVAAAEFDEIVAQVRYDNERMIRLLHDLGFRRVNWELGVLTFVRAPGADALPVSSRANDPSLQGHPALSGAAAAVLGWSRSREPKVPTPVGSRREPGDGSAGCGARTAPWDPPSPSPISSGGRSPRGSGGNARPDRRLVDSMPAPPAGDPPRHRPRSRRGGLGGTTGAAPLRPRRRGRPGRAGSGRGQETASSRHPEAG
ncbi:MAG TPA: GNAT family N-acetyltransferase [Candidatus Dormibacteraeota bacterium]|nr:GNAT family N-acetyltransferase [Candidatus Dormibacteraeota bacterium]